jgi:hypothetical protein
MASSGRGKGEATMVRGLVSWGRYLGATRNLPPNTHPMMPVELGMTDWAPPGSLSALATAAQTASLSSTPPGAQTLEILLLMTIA